MVCRKWLGCHCAILFLIVVGFGCVTPGTKATVSSGQDSPSIAESQAEAYNGPKARIAVSRFTDKTGKGWWTSKIGDGMADQLTTALFNTNRYIVLERETLGDVLQEQDLGASGRVRQDSAAPIGQIEGAELLVVGAVTEFEGHGSGSRGGVGGYGQEVYGKLLGGFRKSHMAIDLRLIDTRTSRIVAATSVEGEATDVDIGGLVGGYGGSGGLSGGLSMWQNTPTEKALRICIKEAVNFVVTKTPTTYYHYGSSPAPVTTMPSAGGGTVIVKPAALNLRSGPGTQFSAISKVQQGDRLTVLERSGDWIRVRTESGHEGWVSTSYTSPGQ